MKRKAMRLVEPSPQLPEEETYQAKLRKAAFDGISESDVTDVVKGLVKRAKEGDRVAVEQLFKHVLAAEKTPQSLVQNNYYGEARPKLKRGKGPVGKDGPSDARLADLQDRATAGEELFPSEDEDAA